MARILLIASALALASAQANAQDASSAQAFAYAPSSQSLERQDAVFRGVFRAGRDAAGAPRHASASLRGIVAPLAAKAREIERACGARVISGVRHTRVAGTHRLSLHASGRAVDMRGNPSCIYAQLRGWPGGYTTDYGRVDHVHISFGGPEHGLRFAHRH